MFNKINLLQNTVINFVFTQHQGRKKEISFNILLHWICESDFSYVVYNMLKIRKQPKRFLLQLVEAKALFFHRVTGLIIY